MSILIAALRPTAVRVLLGALALLGGGVIIALSGTASEAQTTPQTYVVNKTSDDAPDGACQQAPLGGPNDCTLREAVIAANANAGTDTIVLNDLTYTLARTGADDTAQNGDLDLTDDVVIRGSGALVDANAIDRVFDVRPDADVTMADIEITQGAVVGYGGAIRVNGRLDLIRTTLAGNTAAAFDGGAVFFATDSRGGTIAHSTISGNTARYGGGIRANATVDVSWSTITDNEAVSASTGGGILATATVTLEGSIVADQRNNDGDCQTDTLSLGYNLYSDTSCNTLTSDQANGTAALEGLGGDGGLVRTHRPGSSSDALDLDDEGEADCPAADQRGLPRGDGLCDAGSLEEILDVRGSVNQISAVTGLPGATVSYSGPENGSATADAKGSALIRDLDSGEYDVTVGSQTVEDVTVLSPDDLPDQSLYDDQTLQPGDGYLETRDGTLLSYHLELPENTTCDASTPCDLLITYSGYKPSLPPAAPFETAPFEQFTELGYAVAGVNMRGSGCSGGAFDLMERIVALDGYDMVEAFAAQDEWVDQVALIDNSWPGLSQLFVAAEDPPSLAAIVPGAPVVDFYRDVVHPGGIENAGFPMFWAAFLVDTQQVGYPGGSYSVADRIVNGGDLTCLANSALRSHNRGAYEAFSGGTDDDHFVNETVTYQTMGSDTTYWGQRRARLGDIEAPTLMVVSAQDEQTAARPAALLDQFTSTNAHLVLTNGYHGAYYQGAVFDEVAAFLACQLKDQPSNCAASYATSQEQVTILLESDSVMDPGASFTLSRSAYSPSRSGVDPWDLGTELEPESGNATQSTFAYDPPPSPSPGWPTTQSSAAFISDPLAADTVMAGSGSADLWIKSETADVDLQVTLTEVRPDGNERFVQSGWLRASHRTLDSGLSTTLQPWQTHTTSAALPTDGQTWTQVRVELFPFAYAFREGSRIRVTISGPGGGWVGGWAFARLAPTDPPSDVTIRHDANAPSQLSRIALPVVSAAVTLPVLPACDTTGMVVASQPCRVWTVSTNADSDDGTCDLVAFLGDCTLREAVRAANGNPGLDTIVLSDDVYGLSVDNVGTEDAAIEGDLDLTDDVVIEGHGATIDGNDIDRVLDVHAGADVTLTDMEITDGFVWGQGGGVRVLGGLDLVRSTVSDNASVYGGGGVSYGTGSSGGAIEHSTITHNVAQTGGGLQADVAVSVSWSTITDNEAWTTSSPVGGVRANATVTLTGSIVADQTGGDPDCGGSTLSTGHNVFSDTTCDTETGDVSGEDADLAVLADNGGLTRTHLPQSTSPAINLGPSAAGGCPPTDQRGALRDDGACDAGSVEV